MPTPRGLKGQSCNSTGTSNRKSEGKGATGRKAVNWRDSIAVSLRMRIRRWIDEGDQRGASVGPLPGRSVVLDIPPPSSSFPLSHTAHFTVFKFARREACCCIWRPGAAGKRRTSTAASSSFRCTGPTSREGRVHRSFLRGGGVARRPGRQRVRTRRIHELAAGRVARQARRPTAGNEEAGAATATATAAAVVRGPLRRVVRGLGMHRQHVVQPGPLVSLGCCAPPPSCARTPCGCVAVAVPCG